VKEDGLTGIALLDVVACICEKCPAGGGGGGNLWKTLDNNY
jgi:hypothetical protein